MANDRSRKSTGLLGMAGWIVVAGVLGLGIAYFGANLMPEKKEASAAPAPPPARTPAAPPNITFIGEKAPQGESADLQPDDAMVFWVKVERPGGPAQGAPQGGRGGGVPFSVKDETGREYSVQGERKSGGLVAVHLKKGYDKKPTYLEVTQSDGDKVLHSWKLQNIPAPTVVVPDDALKGAAEGVVQLRPGRRGRLSAVAHLTVAVKPNEGLIVKPVAASYVVIDNSRNPDGTISKPGENPFDVPLAMPNPQMARRVSLDVQSYETVAVSEDVTFKSARIELLFGQPSLVVDKDETVTTPSGLTVTLPKQSRGPREQPARIRPGFAFDVLYNLSKLPQTTVAGISPTSGVQLVSPAPATLGLEHMSIDAVDLGAAKGGPTSLLSLPNAPALQGKAGEFKLGPIPALVLRVVLVYPRSLASRRVVLPVDPKPLAPASPSAGPGG